MDIVSKRNDNGFVGIIILVVVILLIGGGGAYYFYTQVQTLENTPKPTDSSETQTQEQDRASEPEEEMQESEVETALLSAVGNYTGTGEATRKYDGEEFTHTVTAEIAEPTEGKFYEGWLVEEGSNPDIISTGKLSSNDGSYTLEFRIDKDYSDHPKVVITEETEANGLDGVPEVHVLEGSF